MKRKKIIQGNDGYAKVIISIDVESDCLGRDESQRMMDALAGEVMGLFQSPKVPFLHVPMVRLKVQ